MSAGDGEVIFDGAGNHVLFNLMGTSHHLFDGLTIRNTDVAMLAGQKEVTGAVGLSVKNCRFENVGFGVWTEYAGSSDFYIADNLFLGREDRFRLIGWTGPLWASAGAYGSHALTSYYAVKVYGPGHVIARNAIAYFHDGIGISTYGTPERDPERRASSIDIYGNDIHLSNDDFIETDGGVHNVRVIGNRGVNAAQGGYSAQPVFGGRSTSSAICCTTSPPGSPSSSRPSRPASSSGTTPSSGSRPHATHQRTCISATTWCWAAIRPSAA
jgi:hypothetical protein